MKTPMLVCEDRHRFFRNPKNKKDMRLQVEIHVMAEQELFARHQLSWDAVMMEEFDYQGGGVWDSVGQYEVGYDDEAARNLQKFADERLKEHGITEFYTEIAELDD